MIRKVSVIGGSGFVGTNFCQQLLYSGIPFEIIDLVKSPRFINHSKFGDVRNIKSLRKKITGDLVVDLAAIHRDDVINKNEYYKTNVDGAKNIITVCKEKKIKKIIFASSVAVYGLAESSTGEDGHINPLNDYGKSKFEAEENYRAWKKNAGNSLVIVRPTVIFGEGNRGNVYNLLNFVATRNFIMIGSGKNKKSMAYVRNFVIFLITCMHDNKKYMLLNYVDSPNIDMNSLINFVTNYLNINKRLNIRVPYRLGLTFGYLADLLSKLFGIKMPISALRVTKFCATTEFKTNEKILINFKQPFTLYQGLAKTLNYEFIEQISKKEIFFTE